MTPLRMAVVGTGALGRHHARILSELPGIELVAVADANLKTAAETAERCKTRHTLDYRELTDAVEAVVIAVPTSAHFDVASDFLEAGVDALVEKPIASSAEQALELVELARRNGRILQVGHVERFNPALLAARPFLRDLRYIRAERFGPFSFRSTDIGVVHDLMIHDIDLVLGMVPAEVVEVRAFGAPILGDREDCAQARIEFADGTAADLVVNRVSPIAKRQMQVWGAAGCVHLDFAARETVCYRPSPTLLHGTSPLEKARQAGVDIEQLKGEIFGKYIEVHRPKIVSCDQLTEELCEFAESVRTRRPPTVDGETALRAMQIADRILDNLAAHSLASQRPLRRLAG